MSILNETIKARSAAKVNLTLDVTGVLPNGYHTLRSLVHTVGLWDELELRVQPSGADSITCNYSELATSSNLCLKAVERWRSATNIPFQVDIQLTKNIPFGAGLGGGSGNTAAILLMLQELFGHPLPPHNLNSVAAQLGADVPLFLQGGALLMEGIGDVLTPLPALDAWLVILKPAFGMGTPEVYRAWDALNQSSRGDTPRALLHWPPPAAQVVLGNDLQSAAVNLGFNVETWLGWLREVGAIAVSMTGSGSAVFGIFSNEMAARDAALKIPAIMAKDVQSKNSGVFVAPLTNRGVELAPNASN